MFNLIENHPWVLLRNIALVVAVLVSGISFLDDVQLQSVLALLLIYVINIFRLIVLVISEKMSHRIIIAVGSQLLIELIGIAVVIFNQ